MIFFSRDRTVVTHTSCVDTSCSAEGLSHQRSTLLFCEWSCPGFLAKIEAFENAIFSDDSFGEALYKEIKSIHGSKACSREVMESHAAVLFGRRGPTVVSSLPILLYRG